MKHIKIFKKVMLLGVVMGLYIATSNAELVTILPCEDVYAWEWHSKSGGSREIPFLKFDISGIPAGKQIDSVFLRVVVYEVGGSWVYDKGVIEFRNVNNQDWNSSTDIDFLENCPVSNTISQDSFALEVGEIFSVDLLPIFLRDYDSVHTYCSIRMDDPKLVPYPADKLINSPESLMVGDNSHNQHIIFYPHEFSPDSAPQLYVYGDGIGIWDIPGENKFWFVQNYPNPFTQSTAIHYQLPVKSAVFLGLYDICGRQVRTLVNGTQKAGYYTVNWDGKDNQGKRLATGIYFCKLETDKFKANRKMLLIR